MDMVCVRFATSKLREYADLLKMKTYGFRGEALASMSFVARVNVTTKTGMLIERAHREICIISVDAPCAYQATYNNGKRVSDVSPCAGQQGTVITVSDLFCMMPARRSALKEPAEYNRVMDIVTKYALHNSTVKFSCKRSGGPVDVHTPGALTTIQAANRLYPECKVRMNSDVC